MGQNSQFNPVTRDYELVQGSTVNTDRINEAAYFVLAMPRGKWIYGEQGQGSELYLFQNAKRTDTTDQLFAARVKQALDSQLVATGRAQSVQVSNVETTRTGTSNNISIEQKASQISTQLAFSVVE